MRWLARGAVGFLLMGSLTAGAAWSITPHHAPVSACKGELILYPMSGEPVLVPAPAVLVCEVKP